MRSTLTYEELCASHRWDVPSRHSSCSWRASSLPTPLKTRSRRSSVTASPHTHTPRRIEFVADLPKTLTDKIRRIELRQRELDRASPT
jgi:acyl-CoA synthetase (AMP-forming)/AMP-acid ligase II